MHFVVRHETAYAYDVPVRLGLHRLRLRPRPEGVRVSAHDLVVTPTPTRVTETVDAFGNPVLEVLFDGSTQLLHIRSALELETLPSPPLPLGLPPLPWLAAPQATLAAYCSAGPASPGVGAFADALLGEVGADPVAFLDHLARTLYERLDRLIRPTGEALRGEETLAAGRGACRDLTQLFMECCHHVGLPCRFVSGYQAHSAMPEQPRQLHAWPEVHLPGAGFRAWDPTHGTRVTDGHVPLSAAPRQVDTMPVEGGYVFDGPTVTSTLTFTVTIETR